MPRNTHSERIACNTERIAKLETQHENTDARAVQCQRIFDKIDKKLEIVNREQGETFKSIDGLREILTEFKTYVIADINSNRTHIEAIDKGCENINAKILDIQHNLASMSTSLQEFQEDANKRRSPLSSRDRAAIYVAIIGAVSGWGALFLDKIF